MVGVLGVQGVVDAAAWEKRTKQRLNRHACLVHSHTTHPPPAFTPIHPTTHGHRQEDAQDLLLLLLLGLEERKRRLCVPIPTKSDTPHASNAKGTRPSFTVQGHGGRAVLLPEQDRLHHDRRAWQRALPVEP